MFKIPKIGKNGEIDTDSLMNQAMQNAEKGMVNKIRIPGADYYWIWTIRNGKLIVLGPYNTREEAESMGYSGMEGNYEIECLKNQRPGQSNPSNQSQDTGMTRNLDFSLQRASHRDLL